ncbi:DUF6443 domain-containing protein [Tenacibaculum sp. C7A-26P2]|uniref:DUF6443 domain-containing protein n=1 Tax=Tenacibaculum sp. C7A-26P2 TaxID=3447504 RepID=UPI003F8591E0
MKKVILLIAIALINSFSILAQFNSLPQAIPVKPLESVGLDVAYRFDIEGPITVYASKIATYKLVTSIKNVDSVEWAVFGGDIIKETKDEITVKWTGIEYIIDPVTGNPSVFGTSNLAYVECSIKVSSPTPNSLQMPFPYKHLRVKFDEDYVPVEKPKKPFIKAQSCDKAIIQKLAEPNDIKWYWQGMNPLGTDTSNSSTTFEAKVSGTYYLRAMRSNGVFSEESSSVDILLTGCEKYTSDDENYIHKIDYQRGYQEEELTNSTNEKVESITYFDALGRAKQIVGVGQSPKGKDIVSHITYDAMGRQVKEYLPYTSTQDNGAYNNDPEKSIIETYTAKFSEDIKKSNPNPFSEKRYEKSPLNRVLQQAAPGYDWRMGGGHEIDFEYQPNKEEDQVREFSVSINSNGKPVLNQEIIKFTEGQLYKVITKDENHNGTANKLHTTEEFKNKQGQVVLKRTYAKIDGAEVAHDTYYVYDDYGNLTYVLPPKVNTSSTISMDQLSELCYQYIYDHRNRLIEKKIPGKGKEYIVYDALDRPVLTQDAMQRSLRQWMFTKYDVLGRAIYTGIYTHASVLSQQKMQHYFNEENLQNSTADDSKMYEKESSTEALHYTNTNFPNVNIEVLTVNYYDNYSFDKVEALSSITAFGIANTQNVRSLATGSKVKVLGTDKWITTVSYYDEKARPIYVYSYNDYLETTDIVESQLDFVGKIVKTRTTHIKKGKEALVTIDKFTYDHVGRLLSQSQCLGNASLTDCTADAKASNSVFQAPMVLTNHRVISDKNSITLKQGFSVKAAIGKSVSFVIAKGSANSIINNTYDELGQLKTKEVGGGLQKVDYAYNVRGWLKKINADTHNDNDLFNFTIKYNDIDQVNKRLYNGNIAQTNWATASVNDTQSPVSNSYTYSYDALNRITTALGSNTSNYNVSGITYDKNGNILTLNRNGWQNKESFANMDRLKYTYNENNTGNKLIKVEELSGGNKTFGFKEGSNSGNDFVYDDNGNMIKDLNKGISNITYNHLNLPTRVTINGKHIDYVYDASGVKLRKKVENTTTDYAGNYVYKNNTLEFFNHPEGYVTKDNTGFKYVYQYKDHLGNVRLSYTDNNGDGVISANTEIVEESNYYPFGLKHKGYNNNVSSLGNSTAQKFKYNGIELEESLGLNLYEMDLRSYDPAIGRFNGIDPVTHHSQGTSVAFDNNPVYFADPSGADSIYNSDTGQYVINGKVVTFDEALAYAKNGGNADGSNNNKPDSIANDNKEEAQAIANDLNRIFKDKFGQTPFSIEKSTRLEYKWTFSHYFLGGDPEYIKVETYKIVGSMGFDWDQHYYVRMLKDIIDAHSDIVVDIVPDKSDYDGATGHGLMVDYYGGHTESHQLVILSDLLKIYSGNSSHSVGGVALHELLRHIHPEGDIDNSVNSMRKYFNLKKGKEHHGVRVKSNYGIKRDRKKLEELKNRR